MKRFGSIAVVASAAYLGFALLIGSSYGIYWSAMDPLLFMKDFAAKFPLFLPGAAVTLFPAFILAIVLFYKTPKGRPARRSWMIMLICYLMINAITAIYHLPVNFSFMDEAYTAAEVPGKLSLWVILHWVRVALALVGSVYAIKGFQQMLEADDKSA